MNRKEKQYLIEQANTVSEIGDVSDGYHTFNSLYNQRLYLFAALINAYKDKAWKTKKHNDGEPCFGGGWFLVGITTPAGDYTYHYELKDWDLFDCKVIDKAPVFDGHTDKDVTRVLTLQPCCASHWIPVEERLPAIAFDTGSTWDCSDDVYIYLATGTYCVGRFEHDKLRNEFYWVLYGIDKDIPVTHWMPLPEAPRKEEEK